MVDLPLDLRYNGLMKEKIENFWYYNKTYVFIGAAILAALLWFYRPSANVEEEYDYCVGIITPKYYDDSEIDALKERLSATHGKTNVLCYHVQLGAYNQDEIEISRLDIDLSYKTSSDFLVDDPDTLREVTVVEFSDPVPVSEIDELKGLGFDDLSFVSRLDY